MENATLRKLTSITLMTIMVAGGLTFAIPGVTPDAHAEPKSLANLAVSTDRFGGPMIVQISINDPQLDETGEAQAEPDVTFGGHDLKMVQGGDGTWYAYVGHAQNIAAFDSTLDSNDAEIRVAGLGMDFGMLCTDNQKKNLFTTSNETNTSLFSSPTDIYVANEKCFLDADPTDDNKVINVIRDPQLPSGAVGETPTLGNNDLAHANYWPFIQAFTDMQGTDNIPIKVIYSKAGSPQEITITYDTEMDDYASLEYDRAQYPHGADVHLTINDEILNIDPTDEDIWTFNTARATTTPQNAANAQSYYHLFDESGDVSKVTFNDMDGIDSTSELDAVDYSGVMAANGFDTTGHLDITPDQTGRTALHFVDNPDQNNEAISGITAGLGDFFVTVSETSPNSGVFKNTDNQQANLETSALALLPDGDIDTHFRDASFVLDYNDNTSNRLIKFDTAILSMDLAGVGSDWGSGEPVTVTLQDMDLNLNSLVAEELDFAMSPSILIDDEQRRHGDFQVLSLYSDSVEGLAPSSNFGATSGNPIGRDQATGILTANFNDLQAGIYHTGIVDDATSALDREILNFLNGQTDDEQVWIQWDYPDPVTLDDAGQSVNLQFGQFFDSGTAVPSQIPSGLTGDAASFLVLHEPLIGNKGFAQITGKNTPGYVATENDFRWNVEGAVHSGQTYLLKLWKFDSDGPSRDFLRTTLMHDQVTPIGGGESRLQLDETGPNTGVFTGTLEYVMTNQINEDALNAEATTPITIFDDESVLVLDSDQTGSDSVKLVYDDIDAQGARTQQDAQAAAPTHTGAITLDQETYKNSDTVIITVEDADLNTDSDTVEIYTVIDNDAALTRDTIALVNTPPNNDPNAGILLEAMFEDNRWIRCADNSGGFGNSITGLVETGINTGVFTADFQIPQRYCGTTVTDAGLDENDAVIPGWLGESAVASAEDDVATDDVTLGKNFEVTYYDFLNAAGNPTTISDSAGISASTGSISLDKTVYPVPFGITDGNADTDDSTFPLHSTAFDETTGLQATDVLPARGLTAYITINDQDHNQAASGLDRLEIDEDNSHTIYDERNGPVTISVSRGSDTVILATAGGSVTAEGGIVRDGFSITVTENGDEVQVDAYRGTEGLTRLGPIQETEPGSGLFELEYVIDFNDGPKSTACPDTNDDHVLAASVGTDGGDFCILQGDILTVEYEDDADASGNTRTVTDSATFDLRNGVLQSDKPVYIIGSNMILTLIEPDFDLDSGTAEEYTLDLIEWDSDADTVTLGPKDDSHTAFDPVPAKLQETGDGTGIFQSVIEIPRELGNEPLDRGEEITLEYTDWGPSGSDYVGSQDEDLKLTIFTSNFGATIALDQNVYTWTDKVFITITAPDHNFDSDLVDEIGRPDGDNNVDPLRVSTQDYSLEDYSLAETGPDTGIFSGEVILTGFDYNADGDTRTGTDQGGFDVTTRDDNLNTLNGPTDGILPATDDDGISVSYEFSEDETVVASALIRWNIGEVQWLEASYPASGTGIVRVIDPDMNWNPEAVDNFGITVVSDSIASGITLTVTETNEATGIFEGTVFFTTNDAPEGSRLRVAEGDTITAKYEDHTLPELSSSRDDLTITATALIGTIVPPLERVPVSNLRLVDALGSTIGDVQVDQQVSIQADLTNGQDKDQLFAYLVQVQNSDGVTVHLSWIDGSLVAGQSFSPSQSWIPAESGTYTATVFVWESVSNPTALSPPVETTITVS